MAWLSPAKETGEMVTGPRAAGAKRALGCLCEALHGRTAPLGMGGQLHAPLGGRVAGQWGGPGSACVWHTRVCGRDVVAEMVGLGGWISVAGGVGIG